MLVVVREFGLDIVKYLLIDEFDFFIASVERECEISCFLQPFQYFDGAFFKFLEVFAFCNRLFVPVWLYPGDFICLYLLNSIVCSWIVLTRQFYQPSTFFLGLNDVFNDIVLRLVYFGHPLAIIFTCGHQLLPLQLDLSSTVSRIFVHF